MKYAGIGSRETPPDVLTCFENWGEWLTFNNVTLRSGGALGADRAFEAGCDRANSVFLKAIFYAEHTGQLWLDHASQFHPAWDRCSEYAKKLHARNSAIMLGPELNDPVDFVMCWTKNGKATGGTGQALRIAGSLDIPIFNYHDPNANLNLQNFLREKR